MRRSLFIFFLSCLVAPQAMAQEQNLQIREVWIGTFSQKLPLPWTGKMELYLKYKPAGGEKSPVTGIVTWHGEKVVRTEIRGEKDYESISFQEVRCLQKDCSPYILGGRYSGSFDERYLNLRGSAQIQLKGFEGTFQLKRVVEEERD